MHMKRLLERLACLESVNDQLASELCYIDRLLKKIGFDDGLCSVKEAAQELFEEQYPKIQEDSSTFE